MLLTALALAFAQAAPAPAAPAPAAPAPAPAPAAAPSAEAMALGTRLARAGLLAAIAPALIERDISELAAEDDRLTAAERARLAEVGREVGRAGIDRVIAALGREYAARLSVEDLRALVAFHESPAADRLRAAEPQVLVAAMSQLGTIDVKKDIAAAFCRETRKLCDRR